MALNKRVLVVDDQQDLREQMAKLLARSSKKSETVSLVRQMRSRLLGQSAEADADEEPEKGAYEVDTAGQGQEALEKVKRALEDGKPYAVMFLDMRMPPGWDGLETAKRVREADKRIEIVIMTAYADHDQETIAKSVGVPEKLLYIKKPFQAEEIFQFALCLTSKWAAEEDERSRKVWLENLIRSISRLKAIKSDKPEESNLSVLKSILLFMNAAKGFIASNDSGKWTLLNVAGLDQAEAASFLTVNAAKLSSCSTAQSANGKYLLPLKRERFSGVAVIYDVAPPNDPEWYKLMNLLVMTASETLSSVSLHEGARKADRVEALMKASTKIASLCRSKMKNLLATLPGPLSGAAQVEAASLESAFNSLSTFGSATPDGKPEKIQLVDVLQKVKPRCEGIELKTEVAGLPSVETRCSANDLREALGLILSTRAQVARKAGQAQLNFKFSLKPEGEAFKLLVEDDGPAIPAEDANRIFEPFALDFGADGFGLSFHIAKRLLKASGINIALDASAQKGLALSALFPKA